MTREDSPNAEFAAQVSALSRRLDDGVRLFEPILLSWSSMGARLAAIEDENRKIREKLHDAANKVMAHEYRISEAEELHAEERKEVRILQVRIDEQDRRVSKIVNRAIGVLIAFQILMAFKPELLRLFGGN